MLSKENLDQKTMADSRDLPTTKRESVFIKTISVPLANHKKTCYAVVNEAGKVVSLFETSAQAKLYCMTHEYNTHSLM